MTEAAEKFCTRSIEQPVDHEEERGESEAETGRTIGYACITVCFLPQNRKRRAFSERKQADSKRDLDTMEKRPWTGSIFKSKRRRRLFDLKIDPLQGRTEVYVRSIHLQASVNGARTRIAIQLTKGCYVLRQ